MPQIRKLLVAAFIGLTVPACAEQMQVPGSAVILDLPVGFTAAHGGLEHERLQALVRVDTNNAITVNHIERILASARVVAPPAPVKP